MRTSSFVTEIVYPSSLPDEPPTVVFPTLLPMIAQLFSSNLLVGTILCPLAQPPFLPNSAVEEPNDQLSWGHNQRGVRIAGWNFVKQMVKYLQRWVERVLPTMSFVR